jgi:hypothetical protein
MELPSCPPLAASVGINKDQLYIQLANVIEKGPNSNLVRVKLKKHKPVWVIDATSYIREYQVNRPPAVRLESEWRQLFALAKEAGGRQGYVLAEYVEAITELKPR